MTENLTILPRPISPASTSRASLPAAGMLHRAGGFEDILQSRLTTPDVKFSQHASTRMEQRGITMTAEQSARLSNAVARANDKGGRDSLVLIDNLAMVVSIRNQTVVTVAEQTQLKENVFTNIDSAVIA